MAHENRIKVASLAIRETGDARGNEMTWDECDALAAAAVDALEPKGPPLEFGYCNHHKEYSLRRVTPIRIFYGKNEYYATERWLLEAIDHDRSDEIRTFDIAKFNQPGGAVCWK